MTLVPIVGLYACHICLHASLVASIATKFAGMCAIKKNEVLIKQQFISADRGVLFGEPVVRALLD